MDNDTEKKRLPLDPGMVRYRLFEESDAPGVVACLKDEYGETYPRNCYYRENCFAEMSAGGDVCIFVAGHRGVVMGFLVTRRSRIFRGQTELSTMVIGKQYRGMGFSAPLLKFAVRWIQEKGGDVLFGHTQMFHTISQINLYRLGLAPCGLLPSVLLSAPLSHSYGGSEGRKLSLGVMVRVPAKRRAGEIFIPREFACYATQLYNGLQAEYRLVHEGTAAPVGTVRYIEHFGQNTGLVVVDVFSQDVLESLRVKMKYWRQDVRHTVNLLLNCSNPSAVQGYRALHALGFFFTGFQPACEGGEYMLLHHPMAVPVVFGDLQVALPFAGVVDFIREKYLQSREVDE